MSSISTSQVAAQSAAPTVLPTVTVDEPKPRPRARPVVRPRPAPRQAARVAPRRPVVAPLPAPQPPAPVAPATTVGTTRTIGAPAPAYAGGQVGTGGTLGLLGSTNALNVPFSTVSYTSKLIEDQQARTAADTLINDSSVRVTTGGNGFDDTFQIRGFQVPATDVGLNGLYGLVAPSRVPAQIIERIELLKGPGALINGIAPSGSIGGGINIVTKRALEEPLTRITPFFTSSANLGLHLDYSRRFGENKEWGVRFNGVARTGEASIDGGDFKTALGALAIDYRGDRLRWTLDVISQNDDTKNFRPQISINTAVPFIPAPPDARSNWYPGTKLTQRDQTIATAFEYDLTDNLTAFGGIGYRDGQNDQTFPDSRVTGFPSGVDQFGNFRLINAYYDSYTKTVSGNAGLRAKFDTGFIRHSMNVAFTGFYQEAGNAYITSGYSVPSNIYNPSPLPIVTAPRTDPRHASDTSLTSLGVVDTMSVLDERVLLTLGVRRQQIDVEQFSTTTGLRTSDYSSGATTPLAGIVVKPWRNVSLYANYAEGLTRGAIVGPGYSNTGDVLAPYVSKQKEAGVKVDWGFITTQVALFEVTRPNSIRTAANALAYDGEQRNRGVELSAYGVITPGLRGLISATFVRPELTNPTNPLERGNDAAGVPDKTFSASLDWDMPWVKGLSVNGRVIYTSGAYLTTANTLRFPDWTRFDVGARYATAINGKPVTFRASVENLFDERYWLTTGNFVTVASPRTFIVSASFDF